MVKIKPKNPNSYQKNNLHDNNEKKNYIKRLFVK